MKTNWPAFRCGCLIVASAVLGGQPNIDAHLLGQQPRPRKMIGVDVGIGDRHEPPSPLMKQPHVDVRIDRGVDDDRLGLRSNDVGQASLAGPADLHELAAGDRRLGDVPRQRPGVHTALEGQRFNPGACQQFCRSG